jgi:hypothetical protein
VVARIGPTPVRSSRATALRTNQNPIIERNVAAIIAIMPPAHAEFQVPTQSSRRTRTWPV